MILKRLRLTGFKSFVDPAELRIEPGLTGVVGPNGCGKSNLLEALRWAMGETSARSLRGAGMEDVIFAGTASRPARDFAEVALTGERGGPRGPDDLEVVRRIERGAGSAYRIDGRDARARDVALLFADAATGAHSPAMVSQGRIGAAIAAKPAERRAMLEGAAGIAGLHVRRHEAELKLRATEANLTRLGELLTEQEARTATLRRQARAAERYRELSERIRIAEARMIFARWREATGAADAAIAEASAAEAAVTTAAHDRQQAATRLAETAALAVAARDAALAARDQASEAGHVLANARAEAAEAARRLAELAAARARTAADREREDQRAAAATEALAQLAGEKAVLDRIVAAATDRLPALDAALADAEQDARAAETQLAAAQARQASEAAEARVAEAARAAARSRVERAAREAAHLARAAETLGDPARLEVERASAADAQRAAGSDVDDARRTLDGAEADESAALTERDAAQGRRSVARVELAALDAEAAALAKTASQGQGADRLLDRLTVAPGFERALAAALGDDLQAGLDPAAPRRWAGADTDPADPPPPAGATRLSDHVEAPAALARRLAQLFVAERDGGQPLAAGQRLVTRDGALRRWDGFAAASGGGAAAAERLERANRAAALDAARPALAERAEAADSALARIETTIAAARTAAQAARATLARGEAALRDARQREDRAAAALERLAGQRADLDARRARVAGEEQEAGAELAQADAVIAALPDRAVAVVETGHRARAADEARVAVAAARAACAKADRSLAAARERRAAAEAEAAGWRARADEAAARADDLARRAAEQAGEEAALADRPAALAARLATAEAGHAAARAAAGTLAAAETGAAEAARAADIQARTAAEALSAAREARAGAAARAESHELRRVEMGRIAGERFGCPAVLLPGRLGFDGDAAGTPIGESGEHGRLSADRERLGPVNLVAAQELAELETARAAATAEREELVEAVNRLRGSVGTLNREGRERLRAAFAAVDGHFRRLFATLFDGGAAHLLLVDSDDPLEAGLEIMAQPPGKRLQSLTLLSGGEQALTAIALIFALFLTNPAPICVLDEVDAPLDDANIERFCDLLDRMTAETDTRYLIVTHNAVTMSRMHRLFGVTMIEKGVSRLVSVDLQAAETLLAAE